MRVQAKERVIDVIKKTFQVTPQVTLLERGTIAREFEANIKAPRFVDRRG
jgi:phenylacetate-CoA ligase